MCKFVYALGDGDRVRAAVDRALLGGDLRAVAETSRTLTRAMELLAVSANRCDGWTVVFVGGDDIFLEIADSAYDENTIRELMFQFGEVTGGTICFGVGMTIEKAYVNLRRAKSAGLGKLVSSGLQRAIPKSDPSQETLAALLEEISGDAR